MPLFAIREGKAKKLDIKLSNEDKNLQDFIEHNSEEILGVYYIASDFPANDRYGDAIDTLGLDENGSPTIILYKKSENDNIINQAVYYLDWLGMNRQSFEEATRHALGNDMLISWNSPKAILIADKYNKFDKYAISRLSDYINLYKYYWYEDDMLYLENIYPTAKAASSGLKLIEGGKDRIKYRHYSMDHHLEKGSDKTCSMFKNLRHGILNLDDSISERITGDYIAYYTTRNFAEVRISKSFVTVYLFPCEAMNDPLYNVENVPENYSYTLDKRVRLASIEDIEKSIKIIRQSYIATL
ncbi:MAG TPA: DUF5655 domain-containing protein [Bacillota bacterium]|nr:DUF5655 domain-containing protein [Bacillota bacterium]